jgi:hypothetical protein
MQLVSYISETCFSLEKTRDAVGVLHLECDLQSNVGRQLHQYRLSYHYLRRDRSYQLLSGIFVYKTQLDLMLMFPQINLKNAFLFHDCNFENYDL